jgi:hypothetical protein
MYGRARHATSLWSTCSSSRRAGLLYGLVILRLKWRELAWANVTADPTVEWIARAGEIACT